MGNLLMIRQEPAKNKGRMIECVEFCHNALALEQKLMHCAERHAVVKEGGAAIHEFNEDCGKDKDKDKDKRQ